MTAGIPQKKVLPPDDPAGRPTLLIVGTDPMGDAIRAAVTRHRLHVETCGLADIPMGVIAAAPDLVLLIGDAAAGGGQDVLRLLALNPATSVVPVAILTDDASLDDRLKAFRYGAVAVVLRTASADAIGKRVADLARELPERAGEATGEIGEATLDEFVNLLKRELRSGILSVSGKGGDEEGAVRIVLGAGRPVADALKDFVQKLKPLVAEAEPLKYELLEESGGRLQLLEPSGLLTLPKADPSLLAGTRILVMDSDPGRADALAQELRGYAAKVAVTEVSERGLDKARGLEPEVLIIDGADLDGPAFALVRGLRRDARLRWTSMLIVSWSELWPHEDGGPDLRLLTAKIAPLISQDHELTSRCQREEQFDTRLETTGPARMVRALVKGKKTLHVTVVSPKANIELDLSQGLLVGATGVLADGTKIAGTSAITALLMLSSGRVRVERRMNPSAANVMTPVDEALAAAWAEESPITASVPPSVPGERAVPPPLPKAAQEREPDRPTLPAAPDQKIAHTMMGLPPLPSLGSVSALGGVPARERLTPVVPAGSSLDLLMQQEPVQTSDPNLTPITTPDDVAALIADEATTGSEEPSSVRPGDIFSLRPEDLLSVRPADPDHLDSTGEVGLPKKKRRYLVPLAIFFGLSFVAGVTALWLFAPAVQEMVGGDVVADTTDHVAPGAALVETADSAAQGAPDAPVDAAAITVDDATDGVGDDSAGGDDVAGDDVAGDDVAGDDVAGDDVAGDPSDVDPDRSLRSLVSEAEGLIRRGEIDAAGPLLERAYELDPNDNHVVSGLARVYLDRGDGTRAVQMAEAAVSRRPRRVSYRMLLARAKELAGDTEGARAQYSRALSQEPNNPEAQRRLQALRD